jgi:hypothetical protein
MFTLDSDIVGLQSHIQEFNPIFRQAFKAYIQGDWVTGYENIERCLELWENDGPTKAMQMYMSYFHFTQPETWNGFRDIDEKINFEELNRLFEEAAGAAEANQDDPNATPANQTSPKGASEPVSAPKKGAQK